MVHRRVTMLPKNTSWGRCVYCSSVNTCQLVFCLSVYNRHVLCTFALWHWSVCQISSLHAWAVCDSLDRVTCYPLHFTLAYIVYRELPTCQVVYIHVHYDVHGEMYIVIDSRLILTLLHYLFSNIKKKGFVTGSGCPRSWKPRGRWDFVKSAVCGLYVYLLLVIINLTSFLVLVAMFTLLFYWNNKYYLC